MLTIISINRSRSLYLVLILITVTLGCREEFMPETIDDEEKHLVIDAMMTNEDTPYTVKLSLSSSLNEPKFIPKSNCLVKIIEKNGIHEVMEEIQPGIYHSDSTSLKGKAGELYKLYIKTPNNKEYETEFIRMPEPVKIDTIKTRIKYIELNDMPQPLPGLEFLITTQKSSNSNNYFLWRMKETYEYNSTFKIDYIYDPRGSRPYMREIKNRDTLYRCYKTQPVNDFFVGRTSDLTETFINNKPLHTVTTETKRLQNRYSLLVKQITITEESYTFWNRIKEQLSEENYFSSKQPYQIRGNVKSINNPDELVLGNFTVGAVDKKRFFVNRPSVKFYYSPCNLIKDTRALPFLADEQYPVYLVEKGGLGWNYQYCFDCRISGGKLKKPEFWKDN